MGNSNKIFLSERTFIVLYAIALIGGVSIATMFNSEFMSSEFQAGSLTLLISSVGSFYTVKKILPIIKKVISENNNT